MNSVSDLPDQEQFCQGLQAWPPGLDWQPSTDQIAAFSRLYEGLLSGNQRLNLTRITAPIPFLEKHLWDSLAGVLLCQSCRQLSGAAVIDIGTGGGFPGLPIAITWPEWKVTLMDSTRKKITFLEELGYRLGLTNLSFVVDRAEAMGQQAQHREQYDLATIRAVGDGAVCAEYGLPLLKVGGILVLYRGQWSPEEDDRLGAVSQQLGGKLLETIPTETPWTKAQRNFVYVIKEKPTPPEFPRAIGLPRQQPLGLSNASSS
ncbi:MAG: rRNA small subunit 7-methylguanosine (m7G) methyltransferase GidB [Cyanobacteriota bacterium]